MTEKPRILFILKYREVDDGYGNGYSICGLSSGLLNSATFVERMLHQHGFETKLVQVIDNNQIDKEVHHYKPTHVIIEAYWVVPEKFDILHKLHSNVKWIIRNHSELAFLANEGIAIEWTIDYLRYPNVYISSNSPQGFSDMVNIIRYSDLNLSEAEIDERVVYLPNYYHPSKKERPIPEAKEYINVSCFGAIRPLKNQLIQAVAAIEFAEHINIPLHFHINNNRVEGFGSPILKNIVALFDRSPKHKLIEHKWLAHHDFIKLVRTMDIGMQVSFTESFNIVTADLVNNGIPVVVSKEIHWVNPLFYADPTDVKGIKNKLLQVWECRFVEHWLDLNKIGLEEYDGKSVTAWLKYLNHSII